MATLIRPTVNVTAFVLSRLHQCNAFLAGLPASTVAHLHSLVREGANYLDIKLCNHLTPALPEYIGFRLRRESSTICACWSTTCPSVTHLANTLTPISDISSRSLLHRDVSSTQASSTGTNTSILFPPQVHIKFTIADVRKH